MTLFTDNPFEKMMIQKPDGRRDNAPPVPYPRLALPALTRDSPLVWGYCLKQVQKKKEAEPER